MTERMKTVLERTENTLCRHLEDLNDQIEKDGGRIKDHMSLDGIKDSVKTLRCIKELMDHGSGETAVAKAAAKTMPGIV
jgi:hypothetical protein